MAREQQSAQQQSQEDDSPTMISLAMLSTAVDDAKIAYSNRDHEVALSLIEEAEKLAKKLDQSKMTDVERNILAHLEKAYRVFRLKTLVSSGASLTDRWNAYGELLDGCSSTVAEHSRARRLFWLGQRANHRDDRKYGLGLSTQS